jgi:hypothetical protein
MAWPLELEFLHRVKDGGGKTGEHMTGKIMHELLMVQDSRKAVQDGGAQRRPLVAAASVSRGHGRPQLRCEWAKRPLGRIAADGPARCEGGRATRVA